MDKYDWLKVQMRRVHVTSTCCKSCKFNFANYYIDVEQSIISLLFT
jgi:hypothetical protein